MKIKRKVMVLVSIVTLIAATVLIVRVREPYAFEEISRFARLGPEGELSEAQVQEILQQSSDGPVVITSIQNDESAPLSQVAVIKPKQSRPDPDLNELRPLPKRGGGGHVPSCTGLFHQERPGGRKPESSDHLFGRPFQKGGF